jgi:tRNA nucleotidyltransferase/poly(A) polymerase
MERIQFKLEIPNDIKNINQVFKENGFKLFIVGGAVRDALLNENPKDFDLVTDAIPDKVEEMMHASGFATIATGKAFGVINVFTDTDEFEIATFRNDSPGRKPKVELGGDILSDSQRRDFTINALYYDIETNQIIDLVGGVEDLKNKIIRTVGDPKKRFEEDPLRILRFFRFLARF